MYVLNCARKASITGRTCKHYKKRLLNTQDSDEPLPAHFQNVLWSDYYTTDDISCVLMLKTLHYTFQPIKGCKLSYGGPYNNGTYLFIMKKITLWMLFEIIMTDRETSLVSALSSIFDTKHALHLWLCSSHRQPRTLCFSEPGSQICSANCWFHLVDQRKIFVHCELWMCS